jgi:hypothetical protein
MIRVSPTLAALALLSACSAQPESADGSSAQSVERAPVGLVTSLPIYWPDGVEFAELVNPETELPWVRTFLESRYELSALDTLSVDQVALETDASDGPENSAANDAAPLSSLDRLMVVQPRGLSPADNVALDDWVKDGGQLLLVLDPMLAGHYAYPLGDPRNPQMSTLVPPVLARWGLSMVFDEQQPLEFRTFSYEGGKLPAVMSGELSVAPSASKGATASTMATQCELEAESRIAVCAIGAGKATIVADATIFEVHDHSPEAEANLRALIDKAFQ